MGNFGPMGWQFSWSWRFESWSWRLEWGPERGSGGTSFEDERQNILENEDWNETFSWIVEEPWFDRNSDND
jgi:hypothetical protein